MKSSNCPGPPACLPLPSASLAVPRLGRRVFVLFRTLVSGALRFRNDNDLRNCLVGEASGALSKPSKRPPRVSGRDCRGFISGVGQAVAMQSGLVRYGLGALSACTCTRFEGSKRLSRLLSLNRRPPLRPDDLSIRAWKNDVHRPRPFATPASVCGFVVRP